jgi:hypothetical protein
MSAILLTTIATAAIMVVLELALSVMVGLP